MQKLQLYIRKALLATVICLSCVQAFSQTPEFAPVGAKWWYAYKPEFSNSNQFYLYEAVKDTVIDGENAVRINASSVSSEGLIFYRGYEYFKEDSTQIAVYRNDEFHTLINYNSEPGDTITVLDENFEAFFFPEFSSFELNNFSYEIDSTSTILLDGVDHKIFYTNNLIESDYIFYESGQVSRIIESIGAVTGLCLLGLPSDILFAGSEIYGLVCYTDDLRTLTFNGFSCDSLFTEILPVEPSPSVILNWQGGLLYITTRTNDAYKVIIYNMQGVLMMSGNFSHDTVIDLKPLKNLMLLINIQTPQNGSNYYKLIYLY